MYAFACKHALVYKQNKTYTLIQTTIETITLFKNYIHSKI